MGVSLVMCKVNYAQESGTFTDPRDHRHYDYISIGDQVWMDDNMEYETENGSWIYDSHNDSVNDINRVLYGRLYTWEAAQEACPPGWHLPSREEWETLFEYLGGRGVAGGKMKVEGDAWAGSNAGATNESGFTAYPGGWRDTSGDFGLKDNFAYFWSATPSGKYLAYRVELAYKAGWVNPKTSEKEMGMSVRCLKD